MQAIQVPFNGFHGISHLDNFCAAHLGLGPAHVHGEKVSDLLLHAPLGKRLPINNLSAVDIVLTGHIQERLAETIVFRTESLLIPGLQIPADNFFGAISNDMGGFADFRFFIVEATIRVKSLLFAQFPEDLIQGPVVARDFAKSLETVGFGIQTVEKLEQHIPFIMIQNMPPGLHNLFQGFSLFVGEDFDLLLTRLLLIDDVARLTFSGILCHYFSTKPCGTRPGTGVRIMPKMNRHEVKTLSQMKQTVKPFPVFRHRFYRFCLVRQNGSSMILLFLAVMLFNLTAGFAADPLPDILTTDKRGDLPCKILKLAEGKFLVNTGDTILEIPMKDVLRFQIGESPWHPEPIIGSATKTLDLTLGGRELTFVAVAPLTIQEIKPYPQRATFYTVPGRYLTGTLRHDLKESLRELRIAFEFWSSEDRFLGRQEYADFDIKPGEEIPFAIDLLHPRGNGQLETIVARIKAYQSRTEQQRNYLRE